MTCEAKTARRIILEIVPLTVFTTFFFALAIFVAYSLAQFEAKPPKNVLECPTFRNHSLAEAYEYFANRTVVKRDGPGKVYQNCSALYERRFFPKTVPRATKVDDLLLFMRVVSQDYEYFEETVTMLFSPVHFYCFPLSDKSSPTFQKNVRHVSNCLFNVLVPNGTFDVSTPRGLFKAYQACHHLVEPTDYTYAIITQEDDVPIQSMRQVGAVAMQLEGASQIGQEIFAAEDTMVLTQDTANASLTQEISLVADLDLWLMDRSSILILSRKLSNFLYDAIALGLLDHAPAFPRKESPFSCAPQSRKCPLGMENFSAAEESKELFVKADPQFDFGFVQCAHELVFNRTYAALSVHWWNF